MQELFLRTLRWFIVVTFTIAGIGFLNFADRSDTIKPVLPGIISLGAAFVLGTAWKDLRRKILFITIVLVVGLAWVAQFIPDITFLIFGTPMFMDTNYFVGWVGLVTIVGFPLMMFFFHKFAD